MNFQSKSLISFILVLVALAIGYFGVLPRWNAYNVARAQLGDAKATQEKLIDAQKQLDTFLAEYRKHAQDAEALGRALPLGQTQMYQVLKNLDELSKSSGLSLAELSVLDSQNADQLGAVDNTIQPVDVTFTVSGPSALAFRDFLIKLEANLRIIDVQTVSMSADEAAKGIKDTIKFRTYYQK